MAQFSRVMQEQTTDELRAIVADNAAAPEFALLAWRLSETAESRAEAREICFRGLAKNPHDTLGRLALARLFYLDGLGEFCLRELVELKKYSKAETIDKLLASFGDYAAPFLRQHHPRAAETFPGEEAEAVHSDPPTAEEEKVVADIDLDFDEALADLEK